MTANPYQSPATVPGQSGQRFSCRPIVLFCWSYPFLLVTSMYGTWLVAWLVLGHMPRPSLDDPKHIGIAVDVSYLLTGFLFVGFPAVAVVGVAIQLSALYRPVSERLSSGLLLILLWGVAIAILRWDPMSVGDWFLD